MPTTLNRDEDILQAAEDWQKAGHGGYVALLRRQSNDKVRIGRSR